MESVQSRAPLPVGVFPLSDVSHSVPDDRDVPVCQVGAPALHTTLSLPGSSSCLKAGLAPVCLYRDFKHILSD